MGHSYDDIFLCVGESFLIGIISYAATQRRSLGGDYRFAVIMRGEAGAAYRQILTETGGEIFNSRTLVPHTLSGKRALVHSFGDVEWQRTMLKEFSFSETGVYADFLKNEYADAFSQEIKATSIIFFGWRLVKPFMFGFKTLELVEIEDIFDTYRSFARAMGVENLRLSPDVQPNTSVLIFLRYWGLGVYKFRQGVSLGDAVLAGLEADRSKTLYIKSDSRISAEAYQDVMAKLTAAGYLVRPMEALFAGGQWQLGSLPAELMMDAIRDAGFEAYVYDSSLSLALDLWAHSDVVFPKRETLSEIFEQDVAVRTITAYSAMYEHACELLNKRKGPGEVCEVHV